MLVSELPSALGGPGGILQCSVGEGQEGLRWRDTSGVKPGAPVSGLLPSLLQLKGHPKPFRPVLATLLSGLPSTCLLAVQKLVPALGTETRGTWSRPHGEAEKALCQGQGP